MVQLVNQIRGAEWCGISLKCLELSNSGNILKLLVLSGSREVICKWVNHSCKVISQMMTESIIDNRGYKSKIASFNRHHRRNTVPLCGEDERYVFVKEQRASGSLRKKFNTPLTPRCCFRFRCALMGFEINYQIRIPSKQINIQTRQLVYSFAALRNPSDAPSVEKINPWFVSGFTDGEGCFMISITENQKLKHGFQVQFFFVIGLHHRDKALLEEILIYFAVGNIIKEKSGILKYKVSSVKDLRVIIDHFDKYPLITDKWSDYQLFKQAFKLFERQEHLTVEGLKKILSIRASMNWGLSRELHTAFPYIIPVDRPSPRDSNIKHPLWLAGFTSAEGCFMIKIPASKSHSLGFQVQLVFQLTQHIRNDELIRGFINYFDCGFISNREKVIDFRVTKLSDIVNKIIPFFQK